MKVFLFAACLYAVVTSLLLAHLFGRVESLETHLDLVAEGKVVILDHSLYQITQVKWKDAR